MAAYYLISQLPSLDGIGDTTPLPITEEQFTELCSRFLKAKEQEKLRKLTLTPAKDPEGSGSAFIDAWDESERMLRFALGKVRAEKWPHHHNFQTVHLCRRLQIRLCRFPDCVRLFANFP